MSGETTPTRMYHLRAFSLGREVDLYAVGTALPDGTARRIVHEHFRPPDSLYHRYIERVDGLARAVHVQILDSNAQVPPRNYSAVGFPYYSVLVTDRGPVTDPEVEIFERLSGKNVIQINAQEPSTVS